MEAMEDKGALPAHLHRLALAQLLNMLVCQEEIPSLVLI
jgi:hypothetical protein